MNSEYYRQSPEFRAEAIRQAERERLAKLARGVRRIIRPFARASK